MLGNATVDGRGRLTTLYYYHAVHGHFSRPFLQALRPYERRPCSLCIFSLQHLVLLTTSQESNATVHIPQSRRREPTNHVSFV